MIRKVLKLTDKDSKLTLINLYMIPCDWLNKQDKTGYISGTRGFIKGFIKNFNFNRLSIEFNAPDSHIDTKFVRTLANYHF